MKPSKKLPLLALILVLSQGIAPSPEPEQFVAATPCDPVARHMLSIPANLDCDMIKWRLALRRDPRNQDPYLFALNYTYGMTKAGTQGFMNDGTTKEISGKWSIKENKGKNPGKNIFTLHPDSSPVPVSFLQLNDRLLHLLDPKENLMIGNGGFSYTLNKQITH
ncbi:hypothetical protein [Dyadobacter sp. MSC1_007]|jgi:hypothetical protein|uniref:hypothetical protein n=1 Tax=Dyadobacter sp. MSC1_007 TaxID=2909264 RepID=UPI00202EC056|nr:hypothetical protein [Dyadobacter sp. MSC1_007]